MAIKLEDKLAEDGIISQQEIDLSKQMEYAMEKEKGEEGGNDVNKTFSEIEEKTGIRLRDKPQVVIDTNPQSIARYNFRENKIILRPNSSREVQAEEFSHFLREKLRRGWKRDDPVVGEFYGFIGRKLVNPNVRLEDVIGSKREVLSKLKNLRLRQKEFLDTKEEVLRYKTNPEKQFEKEMLIQLADLGAIEAELDRKGLTWHYRGYEWASKLDLSRITNWKKFFSMPTREVRMRFFRPNPDYSCL